MQVKHFRWKNRENTDRRFKLNKMTGKQRTQKGKGTNAETNQRRKY